MTDASSGCARCQGRLNCVHRDLASRNVLITAGDVAKVADFGIGRLLSEGEKVYEFSTERPLPLGWMSPEDMKTCTGSVTGDVWAFGVLLWETASLAEAPYDGVTDILLYLETGARLLRPADCPDLWYLAMRECWSADPVMRPSFESLHRRLNASLPPGGARPPGSATLGPTYAPRASRSADAVYASAAETDGGAEVYGNALRSSGGPGIGSDTGPSGGGGPDTTGYLDVTGSVRTASRGCTQPASFPGSSSGLRLPCSPTAKPREGWIAGFGSAGLVVYLQVDRLLVILSLRYCTQSRWKTEAVWCCRPRVLPACTRHPRHLWGSTGSPEPDRRPFLNVKR